MKTDGGKTYTKDDEIAELQKDLKIAELKLQILRNKSAWIAEKQVLNQSVKTKEPISPEDF